VPIRPSVPSEGDDDRDDRDDRANDRNGADAEPWSPGWNGEIETPRKPTTDVRFHVDRRFMWAKFVVAVIFVATPLVAGSSVSGIVIGLIVAVGLATYGLRDVLAPVRLAADAAGSRGTTLNGYVWISVPATAAGEHCSKSTRASPCTSSAATTSACRRARRWI